LITEENYEIILGESGMIMRTGVNYHIQMDMRTQIQMDLDLYILNLEESRSQWIWIFKASTASTPDWVCLSASTLLVSD
jgi:hypothetical protein